MTQEVKVWLTLKGSEEIGNEVAYAVTSRANPHDSNLVASQLEGRDYDWKPSEKIDLSQPDEVILPLAVNVKNLSRYFIQLEKVVCEFWYSQVNLGATLTLKPHEIRNLYLPLIFGVILSSVGNLKQGNYQFVLKPDLSEQSVAIDKEFLFEFSARLESLRQYVKGDVGQIGNRNATPQTSTMLAILTDYDEHNAKISIRDGVSFDESLAGLASLVGLSLVEESFRILYTGVEEVNFRELLGTIKDSGTREIAKSEAKPAL